MILKERKFQVKNVAPCPPSPKFFGSIPQVLLSFPITLKSHLYHKSKKYNFIIFTFFLFWKTIYQTYWLSPRHGNHLRFSLPMLFEYTQV